MSELHQGGDRNAMAEDCTDLAEDRTLMANERTFAGWARTALAAIGIGLGFQALFREVEPTWVAKLIASLFIALGVYILWQAERRASAVVERMSTHHVEVQGGASFRVMAIVGSTGAVLLMAAIWWLV